jgi:hypothetical protein
MIDSQEFTFKSKELDVLDEGRLDLGVPMRDGAIQIGTLDRSVMSRLGIEVGRQMVVIRHIDNTPLQVNINSRTMAETHTVTPIFKKAVSDVVFIRGQAKNTWTAVAEDLEVCYQKGLYEFVGLFAAYAHRRQTKR